MKPIFFRHYVCLMAIGLLLLPGLVLSDENLSQDTLTAAMSKLNAAYMTERSAAIEQLAAAQEPRAIVILQALLEGHLFNLIAENKLVIGAEIEAGYKLSDAKNGQDLGIVAREATQKINLNNALRVSLRKTLGRLELNASEVKVRIHAVQAIAKDIDPEGLVLLHAQLSTEKDRSVQDEIKLVLGLEQLNSTDKPQRLAALALLKDHASPAVVNRLNALQEKDATGQFVETDADVRNSAKTALININSKLRVYAAIETVFFGLSLGAVLVLAAIGLAITFGVMGVINMAHGELMMLGAYTTYVMQQLLPDYLGLALLLSIPAAFMISALVGILIERGIIRFLYGRPLETLLATFGVSLVLQQTVRSIFSPLNRSVASPEWMSGAWQINDFLALTWNRFYILVFCLLVFTLLLQILKRTRLGLEVRAVAQNRNMAKAMGIPTARVDALTFGLGSGIAGVAGVALSQITNVGPNLGQAYIVDSFMVVVFGGVGNLWGTLLAGFSLGIANKLLEPLAGAVLAKILVLVFIILFIQKRPRGLFPQKGRAVEG
ncbi:MAG: urea ABC transporter permease subunit UrtB [Methylococcaceae bacterium]|nr:urea ABC transporter permease subunit UrtB [Methylococcaceae bacterium]